MTIRKSPSGMFWCVIYNGVEVARCDRKWQAKEVAADLIKLV